MRPTLLPSSGGGVDERQDDDRLHEEGIGGRDVRESLSTPTMMMMMMMIEVGMVAGERRGGRGGRGGGMMVRMATRGLCPDGRKSGQYNIRATDPIRRTLYSPLAM
jgi:hypothetical protein